MVFFSCVIICFSFVLVFSAGLCIHAVTDVSAFPRHPAVSASVPFSPNYVSLPRLRFLAPVTVSFPRLLPLFFGSGPRLRSLASAPGFIPWFRSRLWLLVPGSDPLVPVSWFRPPPGFGPGGCLPIAAQWRLRPVLRPSAGRLWPACGHSRPSGRAWWRSALCRSPCRCPSPWRRPRWCRIPASVWAV